MMGLETIRQINRDATRTARRENKAPITLSPEIRAVLATGELTGFKLPFLADYVPKGWKRTDDEPYFVDMSGFGDEGEPALTQSQFALELCKLPPEAAIAMIEHGQFQCYVAIYLPKKPRQKRCERSNGGARCKNKFIPEWHGQAFCPPCNDEIYPRGQCK